MSTAGLRDEGAPRVSFTRGGLNHAASINPLAKKNSGAMKSKSPHVNPTCGAPLFFSSILFLNSFPQFFSSILFLNSFPHVATGHLSPVDLLERVIEFPVQKYNGRPKV